MQEEIIQKLKNLVSQMKDISSDYDIDITLYTTAASNDEPDYECISIRSIEEENNSDTYSFNGGRNWSIWEPMKEEEE